MDFQETILHSLHTNFFKRFLKKVSSAGSEHDTIRYLLYVIWSCYIVYSFMHSVHTYVYNIFLKYFYSIKFPCYAFYLVWYITFLQANDNIFCNIWFRYSKSVGFNPFDNGQRTYLWLDLWFSNSSREW